MANSKPFQRKTSLPTLILWLLTLSPTQAKKSKRSINNTPPHPIITDKITSATPCDLTCLNDGYCTFNEYHDYPTTGSKGYYMGCACPPGYHGGQCQFLVEECVAPMYTCSNGAPCKEDGDSYVCDCSFAEHMSLGAGEMCQRPVMEKCATREESVTSFCMNGGECLSQLGKAVELMFHTPTTHEGCQCPPEFEGPHCEHLKNQPQSPLLLQLANQASSSKNKTGTSVSITLCILFVGVALFVRRRKRQRDFKSGIIQSFDSVYLDNLARDLGDLGREKKEDDDDDDSLGTVEFDRHDTRSALASIDDGVDVEYL